LWEQNRTHYQKQSLQMHSLSQLVGNINLFNDLLEKNINYFFFLYDSNKANLFN
jgi:hypothetical protein